MARIFSTVINRTGVIVTVDYYNKYIFIPVPKTGSCSIHYALGHTKNWGEPSEHHAGIRKVLLDHPLSFHFFKFGFVRNPWDRMFSLYFDFTLNREKQYSKLIILKNDLFSEFRDFNDFCVRFADSRWAHRIFLQPQHSLVTLVDGTPIDFIGRYENLNGDFRIVSDILNMTPREIPHINAGSYDGTYRDYFNNEAKRAVAKFYREDIERYDYTYE
jgi:hypothetical protein